jgi:choline-sulfatase
LGFAQGFDQYNAVGTPDRQIVKNVDQVFSAPDSRPAMVFVHFMRPHFPYRPRAFFDRFGSGAAGVAITGENVRSINDGLIEFTDDDLAHNVNLYDAAIAETDDRVQQVLEGLDRRGVAEETLVVLIADHGEEFMDHGRVGHGQSVYEELIHVPMIFTGPGIAAGVTIDTPVQNIDLLPTLAGLLWDERLPDAQGRDLSRALLQGQEPLQAQVFSESGHSGGFCAVIDGRFKLVYFPSSKEVEFYDLATDPKELSDLSALADHRERREILVEAVQQHLDDTGRAGQRVRAGAPVTTPDHILEQLKALGYVDDEPAGPSDDPE